jgi:hypothetical protein
VFHASLFNGAEKNSAQSCLGKQCAVMLNRIVFSGAEQNSANYAEKRSMQPCWLYSV